MTSKIHSSAWSRFSLMILLLVTMIQGQEKETNDDAPYGSVSFFSRPMFKGYSYEDNYIPGCHKIMPYFRNNTGAINTNRKCLRLYRDYRCEGESLVMTKGTPNHYDLSRLTWEDDSRMKLQYSINSWRPCNQ